MNATKCDAFESATYSQFAAHARMDSDWELAKLFRDSADCDCTEHFSREAALEGLVAESPENLRNAIDAEREGFKMYSKFAFEATLTVILALLRRSKDLPRENRRLQQAGKPLSGYGLSQHVSNIGA